MGNETRTGMLKPVGDVASGNFTKLVNAGYDAVKEVYPDAKVIVHTDKGNDLGNINKLLPYLKAQNARYDVIGLSVYPGNDNDVSDSIWQTHVTSCLENIKTLVGSYGKEVCIISGRRQPPTVRSGVSPDRLRVVALVPEHW